MQKKGRAGVKSRGWPEIGSDGDILLTPYVPYGITGTDDDDDDIIILGQTCVKQLFATAYTKSHKRLFVHLPYR
jgi:hypothetical protein